MSTMLEPVTRDRLQQFRQRWQVLESTQGIAVALLLALAFMLVVIIIDASLVVPQSLRWLLSLTIYGTAIACLVTTYLRVARRQKLQAIAQHFEELDPRLHEQLLSAVELSEDSYANSMSSIGFRQHLQQQVARAVTPVRVGELLPWSSVQRGVLAAFVGIAIAVALAWVPGLNWPHRVARALLPGANLGRISRFDIEVITPRPASTMLPGGAVTAIEARVRGPLPDSVMLETRSAGQLDTLSMRGVTRTPVTRTAANVGQASAVEITSDDLVYMANLTIGSEDIDYRVVAEDAHTPWYRLQTRPRPEVTTFSLRIVQPPYSQLPDKLVTSSTGDIEALRGSRVQLRLSCNQAISQGWLQVSLPDASEPKKISLVRVPVTESLEDPAELAALEDTRFTAELNIDSDFTYRVHLESKETKFTNAFSTEYQVRALVDDAPRLTWIKPEASMLIVEPNQLVPLAIQVEDELPPAEAILVTSINGETPVQFQFDLPKLEAATSATKDTSTAAENGGGYTTKLTMATDLDLLKLKPRVGDTVRVAVQVTDRAGQSTVSTPLELIVSSMAVDPQRRPATEQRIDMASELHKFADLVQPQIKRVRELHDELNKLAPESDQRAGMIEEMKQATAQMGQQAQTMGKQLREKAAEHLKEPQDSVSLAEMERTGQVLARIETQMSHELADLSKIVDASSISADTPEGQKQAEKQKEHLNRLRSASEKMADAVGVLDRRFREFVAHDVLSEVARGLSIVQDFQQQLAATSEEETPAQLKRRQAVVARQLRELEQVMVDRSPLLREHATHGLRGWIEWSGQMAERIERVTADPDDNPNFKEFTKQVLAEVKQHQTIMSIDGGLETEINNGRRELDARSESAASTLSELAQNTKAALSKEESQLSPQLREDYARSLALLQQRKELAQARGDSDAHHVSDLGNTIRATRDMVDQAADQLTKTQVEQIDKTVSAIRKLEAIHNVSEANKHLADLEQIERWNSNSIDARTESPRTWDAFNQRVEQATRALREAGIDSNLAEQVDRVRHDAAANAAGQKISSRRWSVEAQASAESELSEMRKQMDAARAQLDTIARAARVDLMEVAPSVSELARNAAEETSQLQKETDKLSKAAAADEVPELKSQLDQLSRQQQSANEPINDLRDALTEMASVQDLLDDNQRAIARDADTSQQIIDKASEQISESLKPAAEAATPVAAAEPLQKASDAQSEAANALEQIADHFEKPQSGNMPPAELADSRQSLKKMASDMDMAAMDEWYKTAESLSKLAGGDPQQVLEKLEDELKANMRMREELSDIAKQALAESVKSLAFSAEQERSLQSQLEQSDPAYAAKKQLLQQDIQAANERMHQWMQQLSSDAAAVAGRANAKPQQQHLMRLQEQLQQTLADASAAHASLPLEDLQRVADAVVKSLSVAQKEFDGIAEELKPVTDEAVHSNDQDLKVRKREMEDWERRMLQQQARGAQSVERSHDQRARQAENAARNSESIKRNAERGREEAARQSQEKPDDAGLKQRALEAERQLNRADRELQVAKNNEAALKQRLEKAKQMEQEMTARKPAELEAKNPTAELASRISRNASGTSDQIASQLKQALDDAGWTQELAATQSQLQWGQQQQGRVEQSVDGVAGNLNRAARHEQRLDHPKAAERIGQQAAQVKQTKDAEVHTAQDRLSSAAEQAAKNATDNAHSPEVKDTASPAASLAARSAVSAAETELRERVQGLKQMLEKPEPEESGPAKDQSIDAPAEPSVPLDPKMLARMLDELDRQMSEASSEPSEEPSESQESQAGENGESKDDNNKNSSQQSSPSGKKKKGSQTSTMQQASQQLAEQMNRERAQSRQSTAASRMTGDTADTKPAPPSSVRVLNIDRRNGEDWGKLREQAAEQTLESARQTVAPQYRNSVETYFRVLSERGANTSPAPGPKKP